MGVTHYEGTKGPLIAPYDLTINSKGREYLNRVLIPRFAEFFKDGDSVLFVGKHPFWDYSVFFNGPHKQCRYVVSDVKEEAQPDVVDNIAHSSFADNEFDGVIAIGLYDSLIDAKTEDVTKEIRRILKPGGRAFVALTGMAGGLYNPPERWPGFYVDEAYWIWGENLIDGSGSWYGEGENQALFLVMRNKQ